MVLGAVVAGGLWAAWQVADDPDRLREGRDALEAILADHRPDPLGRPGAFERRLDEAGLELAWSHPAGEVVEVGVRVRAALDGCLLGTVAEGAPPVVEIDEDACR